MIHRSCPDCRLRLTAGAAAYVVLCPGCGELLEIERKPSEVLGYQLHRPTDASSPRADALAVAIAMFNTQPNGDQFG